MKGNKLKAVILLLLTLVPSLAAFTFDISATGTKGAALNVQACNPQTTLDFHFSSSSNGASSVKH